MKRSSLLIGFLAAVSVAVAADKPTIVGTIANQAGGQIVLATSTTKECSKREMMFAYTRSSGGKVDLTGCWQLDGESVFVFWDDGEVYEYDANSIEFTKKWLAYMAAQGVET